MADLTKAQLAARVLEHLGVKAGSQTAAAQDSAFVEEAIDAAHERLRKFGYVPFLTSAIPPWAQIQLRDYVAGDVAQAFGMTGQRLIEFKRSAADAERGLARQVAGYRHPVPAVADYF